MIFGVLGIAALAIAGLGIKVALNYTGKTKTIIKNVDAGGDVVGRDKITR